MRKSRLNRVASLPAASQRNVHPATIRREEYGMQEPSNLSLWGISDRSASMAAMRSSRASAGDCQDGRMPLE